MPEHEVKALMESLASGDRRKLARMLTMVENDLPGAEQLLASLSFEVPVPVIGFTGPPGAGKSSLLSALTGLVVSRGKQVAIIAVDPTSPFTHGSLLGDRIRMAEHFTHPSVYIRSMATRGALGGLSPRIFEVTDVLRNAGFDYIFIETVGVGQSEVEIAGLADTTVLVLVPEAGDEVQTLKSGVMEIADIFVVNKGDREGADVFLKNLHMLLHEKPAESWPVPVVKTVATRNEGITELLGKIDEHSRVVAADKKLQLLAEKAVFLIRQLRMRDINREMIVEELKQQSAEKGFNIYSYVKKFGK